MGIANAASKPQIGGSIESTGDRRLLQRCRKRDHQPRHEHANNHNEHNQFKQRKAALPGRCKDAAIHLTLPVSGAMAMLLVSLPDVRVIVSVEPSAAVGLR